MVSQTALKQSGILLVALLGGISILDAQFTSDWKPKVSVANFSLDAQTGDPSDGKFEILEGVGLDKISLSAPSDVELGKTKAAFTRKEKGKAGLIIRSTYDCEEDIRASFELENTGDKTRLLEVRFALPISGQELKWWDGRELTEPGLDEMQYERNYLRMPASAVFDRKAGVVVGLSPEHFASLFAAEATPEKTSMVVGMRLRVVLDPKQKVNIPMFAAGFVPKYGYLDAVQKIYGMYPKYFSMADGVRRDVLTQGGGYFLSGKVSRRLQYEEGRRFGMGWDWAYCPSQRPGEWYSEEKFWDDQLGYQGDTDAHANVVPGTIEEYRRAWHERIDGGWPTAIVAYYTFPGASEISYIQTMPDGILVDQFGKQSDQIANWVKAPFTTIMAYPWGNSYGREVQRAILSIAKEFKAGAMAFDEANRIDQQYGAGIEGDSGRGWDETGVYCSLQVAMGRISDFTHEQKVRGYTMATIHNKPWTYCSATRADVAMHEWNSYEVVDCLNWMRILMGHKPIVLWGGFNPDVVLDWENLSSEQIREGLKGLVAFQRLQCLRDGAFPFKLALDGLVDLVELMPVLTTLTRAGWQAVPAMRNGENLWLSRYGTDLNAYLVAGNPEPIEKAAKVTVDPEYLGNGLYLFGSTDGRLLDIEYRNGVGAFDLGKMGGHQHVIAKALVKMQGLQDWNLVGAASLVEGLNTGKVVAKWSLTKTGLPAQKSGPKTTISFGIPQGAIPESLLINGEKCEFVRHDNRVDAECEIPVTGDAELTFIPPIPIQCEKQALFDFPFTVDGVANCAVVLPDEPTEVDKTNADRIVSYFDWFKIRQQYPAVQTVELGMNGQGVDLPIIAKTEEAKLPYTVQFVRADEGSIAISNDGKAIIVAGPDAAQREQATLKLLGLLDEKYPFHGVLPKKPIFEKAGLVGQTVN